MGSKVIDRDHGMKAILKNLEKLKGKPHVVVGILGEASDDFNLPKLAALHEFGNPDHNLPARSFLRATHDKHLKSNRALLTKLKKKLLKTDPDKILNTIGSVIQGQIVEAINTGINPPLKPQTIKRKGSSQPLIDTGHLKGSVTHEVRK